LVLIWNSNLEKWKWLAKRRRALVETNPLRNSQSETHRFEDGRGAEKQLPISSSDR
jgi:hypothetical protein